MRWIGKTLLAVCLTLICSVWLAGAARALSINVADIDDDLVLTSLNGQIEFSNLKFYLGDASEEDFTLTVLDDGLQLTGPMLAEDCDWEAFAFSYQASALDPDALIEGVVLFAPSELEGEGLTTFAKTSKTILGGHPWLARWHKGKPSPIDVLRTRNFAGHYSESDEDSFHPRKKVTVIDRVFVSAGPGDSAEVLSISNQFTLVPEPGTLALLGGGLLGLAFSRRRSRG